MLQLFVTTFLHPSLASDWISNPLFAPTSGNCVPKYCLPSWIMAPPGDPALQLPQSSPALSRFKLGSESGVQ